MIVLGISDTAGATAALVRDGIVMGCASEERFTRLKDDAGYPREAVDAFERSGLPHLALDRWILSRK